jgi:hypothetical protein
MTQLFVNVGLWVNGVQGYSYQLTRNGVVFQSGNYTDGPLYTLQPADVGQAFNVIIIATNKSGSGPSATSAGVIGV